MRAQRVPGPLVALCVLVAALLSVAGTSRAAVAADCSPPVATGTSGAIDWTRSLKPAGTLKAVMLFVDYSDRPGIDSPADVFSRHVPATVAWLRAVSYGRVTLTVTPVARWLRMPKQSNGYTTRGNATFSGHRQLMQDAVSAADATVDFGGYQLLYVVSPNGSGVDYSPAFTPNSPAFGVTADGNTLWRGAALGNDFYLTDRYGSNVLTHETGHTFGLPDLYDFGQATFPYSTFVGDWDIMGNLDIGAGFLAWQRLQLEWLDPTQIACVAASEARDVRLTPIEQAGGSKAIVVRTGPASFTVAEDRQAIAEDATICDTGLLVYTVDTTVPSGRGSIRVRPAAPDDGSRSVGQCGPLYNAAFAPADPPYSAGSVTMKVMCAVGGDLVVRVAVGVALDVAPSALCPTAPVTPPAASPAFGVVKPPAITGTALVGKTLRVGPPTWSSPPDQVVYQWQLCAPKACRAINRANKSSLKLVPAFAGKSVRLLATATFEGEAVTSLSRKVAVRRH